MAIVRVTSNADEIDDWLQKIIDSVDLTRPGRDKSLGLDLVQTTAESIADLSANQVQADDEDFPTNEEEYAQWKAKKYGFYPEAYGFRTGQMLSIQSLIGMTQVTTDQVTMIYGTGKPPTASVASPTGFMTASDRAVTDRDKMGFMMDLGIEIYGFHEQTIELVWGEFQAWLDDLISRGGWK